MVCLIVGFETQRGNIELKASPPRPTKQRSLLSEMLHHDYVAHGATEELQYSNSDDDCSSCYLDDEPEYASSVEDSAGGLGRAAAQGGQQLYSTSSEPIPVPNSRLRNQHLWQRARWELQQQAHRQYQYEAVKQQHPAPPRVQQQQQ